MSSAPKAMKMALWFVMWVLMSRWLMQARMVDCAFICSASGKGCHAPCAVNSECPIVSERSHFPLTTKSVWNPIVCVSIAWAVCANVCETGASWVRSPSLQFPGHSSIKPVIGEGGPGYTLCWHPSAKNSRLIFTSFTALACHKPAFSFSLQLIWPSFNTSVSFFSRLRSHLDTHNTTARHENWLMLKLFTWQH